MFIGVSFNGMIEMFISSAGIISISSIFFEDIGLFSKKSNFGSIKFLGSLILPLSICFSNLRFSSNSFTILFFKPKAKDTEVVILELELLKENLVISARQLFHKIDIFQLSQLMDNNEDSKEM